MIDRRMVKAQRIITKEWVVGYYVKQYGAHMVYGEPDAHGFESWTVYGNTVSAYTGLKDKNGTPIFENDSVRILYTDWPSKSDNDPRTLEQYLHDIAHIGVVTWNAEDLTWSVKIGEDLCSIFCGRYGYIEVIGENTHPNNEPNPIPTEQQDEEVRREVASDIYQQCMEHGTTWIKKYICNKYHVGGKT